MRLLSWILVTLAIASCTPPESTVSSNSLGFISLDSIVNGQQPYLLGKKINKYIQIGDQTEVQALLIDSVFFDKEWSFLSSFDLNKPRFVGGIESIKTQQTVRYQPKTGQNYLLDYLEFQFDRANQLVQVTGAFSDEQAKSIYASAREFSLKFENGKIQSYRVSGYQKIIMKDTVHFEIVGRVE